MSLLDTGKVKTSLNYFESMHSYMFLKTCLRLCILIFLSDITLLTVFLPILVSFLLDEKTLPVASRYTRQIHEDSLARIMKIGPKYPTQFRTIMASQSQLKTRLEAAVKCSQAAKVAAVKAQEAAKVTVAPAKPTITLKTNFGNFS